MNIVTIFTPIEKHISEIEKWLIEEKNKTGRGFYWDLKSIKKAVEDNKIAVLTKDNYAIGFITYSINELVATIEIAEIKPCCRKKGFARKLVNDCLDYFRNNGAIVTELYCAPKSSELIWKKLDFLNYPPLEHNNDKICMYKPLVDILETRNNNLSDELIELWDYGTHVNELNRPPKWTWHINDSKLEKPIIQPSDKDWQIRWQKGGKTIECCKVKNFNSLVNRYRADFLIIKQLKQQI